MRESRQIILIGPMGVGKSTIGRHLAKALNYTFVDTDHEIEAQTGASVSLIFDVEGENGFRQREHDTLEQLLQKQDIIIATGGGIVLSEENRQLLKHAGIVVYLTADISVLVKRTRFSKTRPLLQKEDPKLVFERLMKQREPLYNEVADIIFPSAGRSAKRSTQHLINIINEYEKS